MFMGFPESRKLKRNGQKTDRSAEILTVRGLQPER